MTKLIKLCQACKEDMRQTHMIYTSMIKTKNELEDNPTQQINDMEDLITGDDPVAYWTVDAADDEDLYCRYFLLKILSQKSYLVP